MICDNCARPMAEHCTVHLIPCCAGKCPATLVEVVDVVTFADHLEALRRSFRTVAYELGYDDVYLEFNMEKLR